VTTPERTLQEIARQAAEKAVTDYGESTREIWDGDECFVKVADAVAVAMLQYLQVECGDFDQAVGHYVPLSEIEKALAQFR